jgi:multiple sugar transport system substrate-binding protein
MLFFRMMAIPIVVALMLSACAPAVTEEASTEIPESPAAEGAPTQAPATAEPFNWRAHEGESIRVLVWTHPQIEYIEKRLQEFTDLTGIDVVWEKVPISELYARNILELATAPDQLDVFALIPTQQGFKFSREGYMEDLYPYLNDPSKTSPDYNAADFFEGPLNSLVYDGKLAAVPLYVQTEIITYRCSLYEKAGLKPPATWDELLANSAALADPAHEMYGIGLRGIGSQAVWHWAGVLWSYGGDWLDEHGYPAINSPEALKAYEMYGNLAGKYGVPGPTNADSGGNLALLKQGKLAQTFDSNPFSIQLADPAQSKVVGDVCFARQPAGPAGQIPISIATGLSISYKSQHKDAAWYFLQWFTSAEMDADVFVNTSTTVPRQSVFANPELTSAIEAKIPGWLEVVTWSLEHGRGDPLPPCEDVAAARDIIGAVITTAIQGGDIKAAADAANLKYAQLLAK